MRRAAVAVLVLVGLLTIPAAAQERPPSVLVVAGEGVVEASPDLGQVEVGVQVQRKAASEAQAQASEVIARVVARLRALGIPKDRVETSSLSLVPLRRPPREGQPEEITGYLATHLLRVTVDRIDRLGAVIDGAVGAGANQLGGVVFTLRDPGRARAQALAAAVADARAKAETIAQAAGVTLGGIVRIEEGGAQVEPQVMRLEAAAPTAVLPGRVRVRAHVEITYRI